VVKTIEVNVNPLANPIIPSFIPQATSDDHQKHFITDGVHGGTPFDTYPPYIFSWDFNMLNNSFNVFETDQVGSPIDYKYEWGGVYKVGLKVTDSLGKSAIATRFVIIPGVTHPPELPIKLSIPGDFAALYPTNEYIPAGKAFVVDAKGQISPSPGPGYYWIGPNGDINAPNEGQLAYPAFPPFSLIGQLGYDGTPFLVGSSYSSKNDPDLNGTGQLYFMINQYVGKQSDNPGSFDVELTYP
jgi:hypothetical protein